MVVAGPFCSLRAVDWRHRGGGAETLSVLRSLANVGGPGRVGQAAQTGLQQRRSTFETPSLERLYYWLEWRADLRRQYRPSSRGVGPLRGRQDRRDRKSTRLNSSQQCAYRMPSSA